MIINIAARGNDPGKLVQYMFSRGRSNEHTNPHTIGGTVNYDGADKDTIAQVVADLRVHQRLWPDVTVPGGGHVWHASLSVARDEGVLGDDKWRAIADDYMRELGFENTAKSPIRWTAIHHGFSAEGNDHIHIVASLIREDGTKVNTWQDMPRSQKIATRLEQTYGLNVLASRLVTVGAGSVPYTGGEIGKSKDTGRPIERVELERRLRALATASQTEAEFVRRARADGLLLRPFPKDGEVTGYSVALPPPAGEKPLFFQGGKVARDLTLPALQRSWPDAGGSRAQARDEWRNMQPGRPVGRGVDDHAVAVSPDVMMRASRGLSELGQALDTADPVVFAEVSGEIAGALAAASVATERDQPGELARAAREVGAWAQTHKTPRSPPRQRNVGRGVALVLLQALHPDGVAAQYLKQRRLVEALSSLHRLHRTYRSVAAIMGRNVGMTALNEQAGAVAAGAAAQPWWTNQNETRHRPLPKPKVDHRQDAPWTAADFRRFRVEDKTAKASEQARAKLIPPDRLATLDQRLRAVELADKLGLSGIEDTVTGLDRDTVQSMIDRFEVAAENWSPPPVPEVLPDVGLSSATAIGEVRTPDQAAAFLRDLERKAALREAANPTAPTPAQAAVAPTPATQSAEPGKATRNADPRTWATSREQVTKPQYAALRRAGFVGAEIAALDKGHASIVISALDGSTKAGVQKIYDGAVKEVAALSKNGGGMPSTQQPHMPPSPVRAPQRGGR